MAFIKSPQQILQLVKNYCGLIISSFLAEKHLWGNAATAKVAPTSMPLLKGIGGEIGSQLGKIKVQKSPNMSLPTCSQGNVEETGESDQRALKELMFLVAGKVEKALIFRILAFDASSNSLRIFSKNAKILRIPGKTSWNSDIVLLLPFFILVRDVQNISKVLNRQSFPTEKASQDF